MTDFDKAIKDKLNGFTSKDDAFGSWEKLEEKLNVHSHLNAERQVTFDNQVKQKVESIQSESTPSNWPELKEKLAIIDVRISTIFKAKIIESLLVFLMLIIFAKLPFLFFPYQEEMPENGPIAEIFISKQCEEKDESSAILSYISDFAGQDEKQILAENVVRKKVMFPLTRVSMLPLIHQTQISSQISQKESGSQIRFKSPMAMAIDNADGDQSENIETSRMSVEIQPIGPTKTLPESDYAMIIPMPYASKHESKKSRFGLWSSIDVNMINTPFDKVYSFASYNREALGKSFGLLYQKKMGRFSWETGIGYSKKVYEPKLLTEIYGVYDGYYFEKSLKEISYKIASIPIMLNYDFLNKKSWNANISFGLCTNVLLAADYQIDDVIVNGSLQGRYAKAEDRLSEKKFTEGFLAHYNISDNYYVTGNMGIGFEKNIFDDTSLFIRGNYSRQFLSKDNGIGPNKDKIHTTSLQLGVVTALN